MAALPPIPSGIQLRDEEPQFLRWGDGWAVVGRDALLPEHGEAQVWSHRGGQRRRVAIGRHVAERIVRHRSGSYTARAYGRESTRFVVALIDGEGSQQ